MRGGLGVSSSATLIAARRPKVRVHRPRRATTATGPLARSRTARLAHPALQELPNAIRWRGATVAATAEVLRRLDKEGRHESPSTI